MKSKEQKVREVEAALDGSKSRTVRQEIELASGGMKEARKLLEQMWLRMIGVKEDDLIVEIGDWDSMTWPEAERVGATTTGLAVWIGEEDSLIWKNGERIADVCCCRGSWDLTLNDKRYFESLEGRGWIGRLAWKREVERRKVAMGVTKTWQAMAGV
jgi:hypothetical protein